MRRWASLPDLSEISLNLSSNLLLEGLSRMVGRVLTLEDDRIQALSRQKVKLIKMEVDQKMLSHIKLIGL